MITRLWEQAFDEDGNKRLCGGDVFMARLIGASALDCHVEDKGDGTYVLSYSTEKAGMYKLYISNGVISLPRLFLWDPRTHFLPSQTPPKPSQ
jgi:Filamin/ABP280 repeat